MNFSAIKREVAGQLSRRALPLDAQTEALIDDCLDELRAADGFRFLHAEYTAPPAFLRKEPYASFLSGATSCLLVASTMGAGTERRIRHLSVIDPARMTVLDAAAGVLLEHLTNARILEITPHPSALFCPGYGGSDLRDARFIFDALKPAAIGLTLSESGMMLPQKSLCGIVAVGTSPTLTCEGCLKKEHCTYRKEGTRCFG